MEGKPEGFATKFYENGNKCYEGLWHLGKPSGKGIRYYSSGSIMYIGTYSNGRKNGKGIEFYSNGNINKQGIWVDDKLNGDIGIKKKEDGSLEYIGEWYKGNQHGFGKKFRTNSTVITRDQVEQSNPNFQQNSLEENINMDSKDINIYLFYIGQMVENSRKGNGRSYWSNGKINFEGKFNEKL